MASSSSWVASAGTIPTYRKKMIGELTRGREIADQLRAILRETRDHDDAVLPAHGMVGKILDSFNRSLLILGESDEVSQLPEVVIDSPRRKMEDSGESCKTPATKDKRGCYKRRRTSETWTKETPTLYEDGLAWRKYGQKVILNAKHPRNYFRCTHKYDQLCQATKQVQQIEDEPPLFKTTYHGHHTCTKSAHHHVIVDAATPDSSVIWSFDKPANNTGSVINPITLLDHSAIIKKEKKEEVHDQIINNDKSSSSKHECDGRDYFVYTELAAFGTAFSSGSDVISSDLYSCSGSTHSMDMDMMPSSIFDHDDFLDFSF